MKVAEQGNASEEMWLQKGRMYVVKQGDVISVGWPTIRVTDIVVHVIAYQSLCSQVSILAFESDLRQNFLEALQ